MIKDLKYVKISSVNPSYLIFGKPNGFFEGINKNKYLTLVPANERKEKKKKYEERWTKIWDLTRSIIKNSDDYDENYMKIKFNSDDDLPLTKTIDIQNLAIVNNAILHENNKLSKSFLIWMFV